jgi:hypothetical protein
MDNPAPRGHPVNRTRADRLDRSEAVAVHDLAVEEIGHCRETDMGMGAHIKTCSGAQDGRSQLIEKDKGAHRAALARREDAANLEATAEVAGSRHDDRLDRGAHGPLLCSGPPTKYPI